MRNKFYSMACAAALATIMLTQALYLSVSLVADTIETEPETEVEVTEESEVTVADDIVESVTVDEALETTEYIEVADDLTQTELTESSSDEEIEIELAADTDPTEETEEIAETDDQVYVVYDHYFSDIDECLVNTEELFIKTSDPAVFTRNTNVVSNYEDVYIIACSSVQEARYVYSYYVDKVDYITDLSEVASVATDDGSDIADMSGLNNGNDAISNLNDIDTTGDSYNGYIALIDTGADADVNYTVVGDDTSDHNGHGTAMLGYIRDENPYARVVSIKVSDSGFASAADVYAGFRLAMDLGVSVINFSMTAPDIGKNAVIKAIIQEALNSGIVVIGAAGNNATSADYFIPGCVSGVITVGAVDGSGLKISTSNYNADYYVIAGSTSEATARFTGLYSSGELCNSNKVFDRIFEDDGIVSEENYDWAYNLADELTEELQAQRGAGIVVAVIDDSGNVSFESVDEVPADFSVCDVYYAPSDATTTIETSQTLATGTYTGRCTYTSGGQGVGTASGFDGAFGSFMTAIGKNSGIPMICASFFGERSSASARTMPSCTAYYSAVVTQGAEGGVTATIRISERADVSEVTWTPATITVTYAVSGGTYQNDWAVNFNSVSDTGGSPVTSLHSFTVPWDQDAASVRNQIISRIQSSISGQFSGKKNWNISIVFNGVGTYTKEINYYTGGSQVFEGIVQTLNSQVSVSSSVMFSKIGEDQSPLSGAVISFTCLSGDGLEHTDEIAVAPNSISYSYINRGIQFETNGSEVTISGLYPNSTYVFHEVTAPIDPDSGNPYELADDITVVVDAEGNCNPGTVRMVDATSPGGPWGSLVLMKRWEIGSDIFDTVSDPSYYLCYQPLDYIVSAANNQNWYPGCGRAISNPRDGNNSFGNISNSIFWGSISYRMQSRDGNCYQAPISWSWGGNHYSDMEVHWNGRSYAYWQWYDGQQVVNNDNGEAYNLIGLPSGYYIVYEIYQEGTFRTKAGDDQFIRTEVNNGWHLCSDSNGSMVFGRVFYIDSSNAVTYTCNWNTLALEAALPATSGGSIYTDYYYYKFTNVELTGLLDINKIDETGTGVSDVERFELRGGSGTGGSDTLYATGIIYDPDTPSGQTTDGHNCYNVVWNYSINAAVANSGGTTTRGWHNDIVSNTNADYVQHLNYGSYEVREYVSNINSYRTPEGWDSMDADGDGTPEFFYRTVEVTETNHTTPLTVECSNRQYRFSIEVWKIDESTGTILSGYEGDTDAAFELYIDRNNNGIIDSADGESIGTEADTDRDGIVNFSCLFADLGYYDPSAFPSGFIVREIHAPDGYYLNNEPIAVSVTADGGYSASITCVDTPYIELEITVNKLDEWTGELICDYEGDYNATFSVYVDVNCNGELDNDDRLLDAFSDTDRNGIVDFSYTLTPDVIRNSFPECVSDNGTITGASAKNYPINYLIVEEVSPYNYYINGNVFPIVLEGRRYEASYTVDVNDTPYHTHILIYKLDGDNGESITEAQFTIYDDVDGNGTYTEGVDTTAKTFVNGRLEDACVNWNQDEGCYISSELRSGSYIVVETQAPRNYFFVDSNGVPTPTRNETNIIIEEQDTSTAFFAPIVYETTFYNLRPYIHTTLIDPLTQSHTAHIGDEVELVDTVTYRNLIPDVEYVITGIIHIKETGEVLLDVNGMPISASVVFNPDSPDGEVEVVFTLDTQRLMSLVEEETLNAPVDLVAYEYLELNSDYSEILYPQWYDEDYIATHEDIGDEGQTVRVGEIRTGVYDSQTLSQVASVGYATIIDNVYYEGLQPGRTYRMEGRMHLLTYDDSGNAVDGGVIEGADSREILHPFTEFTPESHEGFIQVRYVINTDRFRGQTMVFFEDCYEGNVHIMFHHDIEDMPQTLYIPDVYTNAYCPDTVPGDTGRTTLSIDQRARIVDEVVYDNLLIDGREYQVQGTLYWMYEDDNGYIHSGSMADIIGEQTAMSTVFFTPTEQSGRIEMTFTFDSTVLADLHYDRLVVCETILSNGGIGWYPIAKHWDFSWENNSQSVYIPDIHTDASTSAGNTLPDVEEAIVTDRVFYENLIPGTEYTMVGNVQYVKTDAEGNIIESGALIQQGQEVKSQISFVPSSESGFVDVVFTVNALELVSVDKLVVFEELYSAPGVRVAIHADITDDDQTIELCSLGSMAHGSDGRQSVAPESSVLVIDTVYYRGLTAGNEYRVETDLMNSSTGQSDAHISTVFVPETSTGSIDIEIHFDGSDYTAEKLVVFESVYDNRTGMLIKSHQDWNETSQMITFIPQTGVSYDPFYRNIGLSVIGGCVLMGPLWFVYPSAGRRKKIRYEKN
ncbi:MAG: VaFE repeat-containing surface-anchored protein [Clostridiales bacterium]|nr:VaFE repeat-containing surface-anchored protein [Clostridiales bacterium]